MAFAITGFNIGITVFGGWATIFGLFSNILKDRYYLSEALLSFLAGAAFLPVAKWLNLEIYENATENLNSFTLDFSRLVLGVQLVLAGIQLPAGYLRMELKSLAILLGPGMVGMWACSGIVMWTLIPGISFLQAAAIAACITPTDPVLSTSIIKGRYADENVPTELQQLIIAESGANDGLGYPFLFIALYLIKYTAGGENVDTGAGLQTALRLFLGETCVYVVLLSALYGWCVGSTARRLLQWAKENSLVERESFLVFALPMALFITGTCGMVGSDDVLACFVAGNAFTLDDWFRLETLQDSLQPTVDMMLNMSIFMWFGFICPWEKLWSSDLMPWYSLAGLAIGIPSVRRLPVILGMHRHIRQIENVRQALFMGYFGPIGVSAIFYLYVGLEFLEAVRTGDEQRAAAKRLGESMTVVIWFLVACSIVSHRFTLLDTRL
ncbi:Cation/H+ exchanger [Akanthomyces lecanii RCEF 1005]|uniref:Cation/H+ exchanger n=1 Tax=Akanthomyces lecanii RCEF 1005 TaxID=1081108 RepID=A0A162LDW8_CORDF|nr:Cation/H+ exchanger [Akanthomyces lecanii RCEF 1005]